MKGLILSILFVLPLFGFTQWNLTFVNDKPIYAIEAVNPDTAYVVGYNCAIRTLDGGNNWSGINYNCDDVFFKDVDFPTSEVGYIISSQSIILKTENYGNSWEQVLQDTMAQFIELEFLSPDTGWIIGNYGGDIILRTYDGGVSWNYYYPESIMLNDINMINSNVGYITHMMGILKTTDGGDSWYEISGDFFSRANCCSFINTDTGYVGVDGLFRTENGGDDWTYIPTQTLVAQLGRSQLQFINIDTGYYAGYDVMASDGILGTTTNGGVEWKETRGEYYDIDMCNNNVGYCIKSSGEIYKTTSGGILVGNNELQKEQYVTIKPNPFINELYITVDKRQMNNISPIVFEMYDIFGNKVYTMNIENNYSVIQNLSNLNDGIYLYLITNGNTILDSGKLLKKDE